MSTRIITICALCVLMLGLGAATAFAADIHVNWAGGADYTTIQAAINAANPTGDVIYVAAGTYSERPVVNKSLTIIGADEATVIVDAGAAASGSYGFSVTANGVTISDLTLVGNTANTALRYGFKVSSVSNFTLTNVTGKKFYRTAVDLLGVSNGVLTNVTSKDNDGHGFSVLDCNNVTLTNTAMSGNGWQGVSVATWGNHSPLGTSGIVFAGTNSFVDPFQLEMGDYNNAGFPPAGAAIITYSTNPLDLADVTVLASDYGYAVHGEQDDAPDQVRIWFADTFANAALLPAMAPIGHFNGNHMYIESLTIPAQLYATPGCEIQAAVDASADGGAIDVSDGTYTEAISIGGKGVTITGESEAGTIVEAAASQTGSANTFTVNAAGKVVSFNYLTIRHGDYGIRSSAGNVDVLHCTFYHNGWDGTGVPVTPTQSGMATFFSTYSTNGGAMRIENSGDSEIAHCTVYENDRGIRYEDGANGDIHDNVIHDNIESAVYLAASTYTGASGCSNTDVYDNECYGNMEHGLLCIGGIGNTFTDNDVYDNWNAGLMMWHAADVTMSGSAISGNNIYPFNGVGNASDARAAVYAVGATSWNTGGSFVFKLFGNDIANNLAGSGATATGVRIGTPVPAAAIEVKNNVFTGHDIDVHVSSQAALADVNYNSFTGTSYGVFNEDTAKAQLDAEMNWWGAADGPSGAYSGSGVPVSTDVDYDPWIGKAGGENIVCDPDPLILTVGDTDGEIAVKYLGGGSGLVAGYSVKFSWVPGVASTSVGDVSEGPLLSSAGSTQFMNYASGTNEITVDCALLSGVEGVSGPGTMFTIDFDAVAYGTGAVGVTLISFRDKDNAPLSGFYADDGEIQVDITNPSVTGVAMENLTLSHTDEFAKDTDYLKLSATVTDDYTLTKSDIVANFSTLLTSGDTAFAAEDYTSNVATWVIYLEDVDLEADGLKTVTVTATDGLGNTASGSDEITVDNTLPGTVAGLAAGPAHEAVVLSWDNASGEDTNYYGVMVRYNVWGDYADYAPPAPAYPADETEGAQAFSGTGMGTTFGVVPRDIHYFSAFVYDWALNYGTVITAGQDRSTNYWLGDVATTLGVWGYNGLVNPADINWLGGNYGSAPPDGVPGYEECDVGPTDDHSRVGIPTPDNMISFEDLMIFAMNYGVVAAKVVPFLGGPVVGDLALALVENGRSDGGVLELALRLEGNLGDVKGLTAELEFEGLEFLSARLSDDMSSPMADMFFWSDATPRSVQVDAAVLGTDVTIGGSGDVAVLTFQVLDETYAVDFTSAQLRGAANEDLTAELEGLSSDGVPVAFKLIQNSPNPFNPVTKVAYQVPSESRVTIRVFDVTGRLVTTLVDGVVEPGRHAAIWNGTNDRGESVGSGVYFCTMETPDYSSSQKMTLLK